MPLDLVRISCPDRCALVDMIDISRFDTRSKCHPALWCKQILTSVKSACCGQASSASCRNIQINLWHRSVDLWATSTIRDHHRNNQSRVSAIGNDGCRRTMAELQILTGDDKRVIRARKFLIILMTFPPNSIKFGQIMKKWQQWKHFI